jgi:hypothetical protein
VSIDNGRDEFIGIYPIGQLTQLLRQDRNGQPCGFVTSGISAYTIGYHSQHLTVLTHAGNKEIVLVVATDHPLMSLSGHA